MLKMSNALTILSGRLVSVRRYATVHGRGTRSHVSVWTKERYEVWVRQGNDVEAQITIRSALFPARTGHQVTLLIDTGEVLGLIDWTTRKRVNYLRAETIGVFRRVDLAVVTLLAITTAMLWGLDGLRHAIRRCCFGRNYESAGVLELAVRSTRDRGIGQL